MSVLALAVLVAALPAGGAVKASSGAAGRWEGTVAIADREVPVAIDLAPSADGQGWVGSVVLSGLGVKGAPLSEVSVAPPRVSFALASPLGENGLNAKFELQLEALERMSGTLAHAGRSSPLALRRTGEAQVDLPPASTAVVAGAVGEWQGGYELFGYPRKVTLRLENQAHAARATFVIEGKRHNELPVDLVRQEGETLFVVSTTSGIRYEGRLSPAGDEIAGVLLQGPLEVPLTLRRAQGGSAR
jgi:hypothetical protein